VQFVVPTRTIAAVAVLATVLGCGSTSVRSVDMRPPERATNAVPEALLLDVGVAIFDANIPEDYDEQIEGNIAPEVRRAEGNYIAYFLKNVLQDTGQWGAVRVVPRHTNAVDVIVSGKIIASDGERLQLEVTATDATDTVWFTKRYEGLSSRYAYDVSVPREFDPFQTVYREIADDLLAHRKNLDETAIGRVRTVAEMKFAREFAPDAFANYVEQDKRGQSKVVRLPATNDPMLARVRRVREREYLFIDTLDEYFAEFHRKMFTPYQEWRLATYDEAMAYRELKAQSRARMLGGALAIAGGIGALTSDDNSGMTQGAGYVAIVGGALAVQSAVKKRAEAQIHADVLQELGVSAEAEIAPHTIDLENRTVSLSGTVDAQYDAMKRVLRQVYYEELGLALPPEPALPAAIETEPDAGSDA